MATKIGYVQREPTEQINWAEVGANFSGMLKEEVRVREEKKAEIDRATREQQRVLDDAVTGDSKNMNEWALAYAADAQKQLLMMNTLLKSGQLKPRDYTVLRQNTADGTDQAFTLAQEYQDEYKIKMARHNAAPGETKDADGNVIIGSQALEIFLMGTAEGFGNFEKSKLVINPQTGKVMVGFYNSKGELESDPNKLVGINTLRNRIKGEVNAYDVDAAIVKVKEGQLGVMTQVMNKMGGLHEKGFIQTTTGVQIANKTTRDAMVLAGTMTQEESDYLAQYSKTEDSWVESQLSNQYNITSLLTQNLNFAPNGESYDFTYDKNEESENMILLKNEGNTAVPDFSSAQGKKHREAAKQELKTRLRGSLDVDVKVQVVGGVQKRVPTPRTPPPPPPGYVSPKDHMGMVAQLYFGNKAQQDEAGSWLRTQNDKIIGIDRDGDSVILVKKGENKGDPNIVETLSFKDVNNVLYSQESWVTKNANFFATKKNVIQDVNQTFADSGFDLAIPFNPTYSNTYSSQGQENESIDVGYSRELFDKGFIPSVLVDDDETTTINNLEKLLASNPATSSWSVDDDGNVDITDDIAVVFNGKGVEVARFALDNLTADNAASMMEDFRMQIATLTDAKIKEQSTQGKLKQIITNPFVSPRAKKATTATPKPTRAKTAAPTD